MAKSVLISDDLAALIEERAKKIGYASLDAAAEALISQGLAADAIEDDHSDGRTPDELKRLIDAAEASGETVLWDAKAVKSEVLRRYAARAR